MVKLNCTAPTGIVMGKYMNLNNLFEDRRDAGRQLVKALGEFDHAKNTLVLALPRGGVPVADEVAWALSLPLDLWLVRKLGAPGQRELAIGAIASGGVRVFNQDVIQELSVSPGQIEAVCAAEERELERRNHLYRSGRAAPEIAGLTVIVVDDGLATGASMHAAVKSLREAGAKKIIVAVPVCARESCETLKMDADRFVCLHMPAFFRSVGECYHDFSQTEDAEVLQIMAQYRQERRERPEKSPAAKELISPE